ncbi:hypothetical protein GCM10010191_43570 [Actinomadura vinacea]|uniref:DUF397 domain-containing protein n=1 Tax=Actinomadura vinacea TaxID=115336 RepID=A0ABN3JBM3_9ACTN
MRIAWRKPSMSGENGGACIELMAATADLIVIRDSKDPHGPQFRIHRDNFERLTKAIKNF